MSFRVVTFQVVGIPVCGFPGCVLAPWLVVVSTALSLDTALGLDLDKADEHSLDIIMNVMSWNLGNGHLMSHL